MTAPDLFGTDRYLEPANRRPDLRDMATLADELERELRETAAIQRNPFHRFPAPWLAKPKRLTLSEAAKRLTWTTRPVWDIRQDNAWFPDATEWLKARRTALGLSNDI